MQFQEIINENGERLWIPLLAGAAILTAPFWLGNNKCCNNNYYPQGQPVPYPYPVYQTNYYPNYQTYPYVAPYPYPIYQQTPNVNNFIRR